MLKYIVTIEEHIEGPDTQRVWQRLRDQPDEPGGDTHGYAPASGNTRVTKTEVYKQSFDEIDLKKVVTALNSKY
jgi:hypothetical protein